MNSSHGGNVWAVLEKGSPAEALDFSADLNPLGPPPGLEAVLREGWGEVALYPEPTYRNLRQALARAEGVEPSCILPGNGTADLIHLITRWKKARHAVVCVPTFTEYERAVLADGGEVYPWLLWEEEEFLPGAVREFKGLGAGDLLFLCNPNNPTGRLWPRDRLLECLERCDRLGVTAVVDEAYMDFVEDELRFSAVRWIERFPRLILLRSMTKAFAVPGLRLGYGIAAPEVIEDFGRIQPPWPVNGPAALAGSWLAGQAEYLESCRRSILSFRQVLREQLGSLPGLRPVPSEANFFLCRLTDPSCNGPRLAAALAEQGILVRVCDDFTGLEPVRFIRVAVRKPEENDRLISALREALSRAG